MTKIYLLFLIWTIPAMACPDLEGVYSTCHEINDEGVVYSDLEFRQSSLGGVSTYNLSYTDLESGERIAKIFKADGKVYVTKTPDPQTGYRIYDLKSVACDKDKTLAVATSRIFKGEFIVSHFLTFQKKNELLKITIKTKRIEEKTKEIECY